MITIPAQRTRGAQFELVSADVIQTLQTGADAITPARFAKWRCTLPIVPLTYEELQEWIGKLAILTRPSEHFMVYPPGFTSPQYVQDYWTGSSWTTGTAFFGQPLIDGSGQSGPAINVKNLVPNHTFLEAGDYVEIFNEDFNTELKVVTEDCVADASGLATLNIAPDMRVATLDNGDLNPISPKAIFRLTNNAFEYQLQPNRIGTITLQGIEVYD